MADFADLRCLQIVNAIGALTTQDHSVFANTLPDSLTKSAKKAWKSLWEIQLFQTNETEIRVDIPLSGEYSPGPFYKWCNELGLIGSGQSGGIPPYFSAAIRLEEASRNSNYFEDGKFQLNILLDDYRKRVQKLCDKFPEGFLYGENGDPTKEFPGLKGSGFGINAP